MSTKEAAPPPDEPGGVPTTPEDPTDSASPPAGKERGPTLFGAFSGVFTPTLLTILGVIMFLRLGWVVGNAGLLGAILIVLLAIGITLATGLSLSSIATNTRLGAGGPYAIISKSLGLEVGGSVGVPLYLSQALAVAMYVFGFREGWNSIFPDHPALLVDLVTFGVIFLIAFLSANLAFRIQYVVMAVIVASLVAIFGASATLEPAGDITIWGNFPGAPEDNFAGTDFWTVFAVFFPAATGIMAGANMSGELKNPRRSIPVGTLAAIGISSIVYLALAVFASRFATNQELTSNYTVLVDKSLWKPLVVAGLLGATFSSALSSLVGAPRIMMALGRDELIPGGGWFAKEAPNGEPRRAMLITGAIVLAGLMLRDLNAIAPLITMFFLIAYAVINLVMLIESSLGLVSFRPTFRLPRFVPLIGALGCLFAMFIVNPTFSLIAMAVVVGIYLWILWRGVARPVEDVRSGIFVAFAEWAAAKVIERDLVNTRAWKPNLLVPVTDPATLRGSFRLLVDLGLPEGSVKLLGIATSETVKDVTPRIRKLAKSLQKNGLFTTCSILDSTTFTAGIVSGLQALGGAFFRPNTLFLRLPIEPVQDPEYEAVIGEARRLGVGIVLFGVHPQAGLGQSKVVNLWVRPPPSGLSVAEALRKGNMNLGVLTAYRLSRAWKADLNVISVVESESDRERVRQFIEELRDLCRLPKSAQTLVVIGDFETAVGDAPQSDMDIIGMSDQPDLRQVREVVRVTRSSCIFVNDSEQESALA